MILFSVVVWRALYVDWDAVASAMALVGPMSVLAASGLTMISYRAAGQYDALVHRHLHLSFPLDQARRAGMAAIAISQTVGLGLVTGTLVRARLLPGIPIARVTQITVLVGISFILGWAVLLVTSVLAYHGEWGTAVGFLALIVLVAFRLRQKFPTKFPDLATFGGLFTCTTIDCLAAGASLLVMCGAAGFSDPSFFMLAFLFAFGAGLMSGAPAGVGAFEIVFLSALAATIPKP
jgi:phosphatidylglycerol lysyltransferase